MKFTYTVIKSARRTFSLSISRTGEVTVRAPRFATRAQTERFIASHSQWIEKNLSRTEENMRKAAAAGALTEDDIAALAAEARRVLPERVRYWAEKAGVTPGRITIRNQKTRWGSCSSGGNLSFNCLLMLAPDEVVDSVIVHELCHIRHMDHSAAFYKDVCSVFPDYPKWNAWLKKNGPVLMARCIRN